jgi:RimJ/RimL family protein N-acetyltransferase/catechol 2,3-dioxygenase-like lactoylglutathione lyase family enzyme
MRMLATPRLDLLLLDPRRDARDLHELLADPLMYRFAPGDRPTGTVTETRHRLGRELDGNGGWTWVIRQRPSDAAIGTVGLFQDQGTPIRGLDWKLRRDRWGRGIMGEAARAAVDHLLTQPGIDGVEAWIDSQNVRSLGVARHAGLDERGRLPLVYDDRVAQSVVMTRAARPGDPETLAVRPTVAVRDLGRSIELLTAILGLHEQFRFGEPPSFARLGVGRWSGSPGLDLRTTDGPIAGVEVALDVGISPDVVHRRVIESGLQVVEPIDDKPWYRREFRFALPEGHLLRVIGPTRPAQETIG